MFLNACPKMSSKCLLHFARLILVPQLHRHFEQCASSTARFMINNAGLSDLRRRHRGSLCCEIPWHISSLFSPPSSFATSLRVWWRQPHLLAELFGNFFLKPILLKDLFLYSWFRTSRKSLHISLKIAQQYCVLLTRLHPFNAVIDNVLVVWLIVWLYVHSIQVVVGRYVYCLRPLDVV